MKQREALHYKYMASRQFLYIFFVLNLRFSVLCLIEL